MPLTLNVTTSTVARDFRLFRTSDLFAHERHEGFHLEHTTRARGCKNFAAVGTRLSLYNLTRARALTDKM